MKIMRLCAHLVGKVQTGSQNLSYAGIIFYSDATHLTNFSTASLYPMYMYIWEPITVHLSKAF